jgi:uncharacterized protein YndB with AHSA1/START domain
MTADPEFAVIREVLIRARPATVFRYFTDSERFAAWFGAGSTVDPRPGGAVRVTFPGGHRAEGEILEVEPDHRVVFTWGFPGDESPLPPGASRVEVVLDETREGTRLRLRHVVPTDQLRREFVGGWRHHLSHLATLAGRDAHPGADALLDRWYAAWSTADAKAREAALRAISADGIEMVDDLVTVAGVDEVVAHVVNVARFMPGATLERSGPMRTVADQAVCDWSMTHADRGLLTTGRTVATIDLDGRLARVVGFWDDDPDDVSRRLHGIAGDTGQTG